MRKGLIEIFATHRVAANLLMATMLLVGFWSLTRINTQFLPNFSINFITVTVDWPGATAQDLAKGVTIPIEEELRDVDHLKKMSSRSRLGATVIYLEFEAGTDMSEALDQVKQRVGLVRNLPVDSEPPEIIRLTNYEQVARIIVSGGKSLAELRPLVYRFERQLLDRGIAKVSITGLPDQEIAIQVPAEQLVALNMSLNQIADLIAQHSQDTPAGSVGRRENAQELRGRSQKRSIWGFVNLPLLHDSQGRLIRLGDIATITKRARDAQTHVYYQGRSAVELTLFRTETSNALTSANIFHQWLNDVKPRLPRGVKLVPYQENWRLIKERINLLTKNAFWGLVLILIILFLFLNFRVAFWIAIGIPISFLAAIAVLYMLGGSINMMSLFAMIMTLGIIVDDSIVVGEEILVRFSKQLPLYDAVTYGAKSMLPPISASSLSTIVTFLPLMLVGGIIGQVLFDIPLVTICVILAALVECFLVLPGHLYRSLQKGIKHQPPLERYFTIFRDRYFTPFVSYTVNHAWTTVSIVLAAALITIALLIGGHIKFDFFPNPEGSRLLVNATMLAGTPSRQVNSFLQQLSTTLEKTDQQLASKGHKLVVAYTLVKNRSTISRDGSSKQGEQYLSMNVELVSSENRKITNQAFIDAWRNNIQLPADIESFAITTPRSGPPGLDIDIELSGSNLINLKESATFLNNTLRSIPGVSNVKDDLPYGKPHVIFKVNSQGHALGLTAQEVGQQLRAAFNGKIVQIYHEPDEEIEVRVVLPDHERDRGSALYNLPIVTAQGKTVPLASVVSFANEQGFEELRHVNSDLTVKVTADVNKDIANINEILSAVKNKTLPYLQHKYKINFRLRGRAEEQAETLKDMLYGLGLAVVLVYIILAWVFSSYGWPFLIMVAIPLGLMGAIWGHIIIGIPLTLLSLFGFFGLAGIVINDSIILINRYRKLLADEIPYRQAIIEAVRQRLRPVLLTSATTIAGLIPLVFERSLQAQFLIPMAVSIVFGLLLATVLILILIPAMLFLYERHFFQK